MWNWNKAWSEKLAYLSIPAIPIVSSRSTPLPGWFEFKFFQHYKAVCITALNAFFIYMV